MKAKDIRVGMHLYTRVSGERVEVVVIADTHASPRAPQGTTPKRPARYRVQRVDTGATLGKLRTAASLHATPDGPWPSMTEKQTETAPEAMTDEQKRQDA